MMVFLLLFLVVKLRKNLIVYPSVLEAGPFLGYILAGLTHIRGVQLVLVVRPNRSSKFHLPSQAYHSVSMDILIDALT